MSIVEAGLPPRRVMHLHIIEAGGGLWRRGRVDDRERSRPRFDEAMTRNVAVNGSILPEPVESIGAQLSISHRVRNVAVAQVVLQRAGVHAIVGELEAAGMAQHVRMNGKGKFGQFSGPADHFEEPGPRHWPAAFG